MKAILNAVTLVIVFCVVAILNCIVNIVISIILIALNVKIKSSVVYIHSRNYSI